MKPYPLPVKLLAASVFGLALAAPAQQTMMEYDPYSNEIVRKPNNAYDWTQHIRADAFVGLNVTAKFTENGVFNVNGSDPAKGIFNNGYVRTDQTGNAGGLTGFWGYDNQSQLNQSAPNTVTFNNANSFSSTGSSEDRGVFPGGEISYGGDNLWNWKQMHVGWEVGLGIAPISIKNDSTFSTTVNQTAYTFSTAGIVVPGAPYQGGPSGVNEPGISPTPISTASGSGSGTISGTRSLDVLLFALRLGPTLSIDLPKHFSVNIGAGPALGIVTGYYRFNETITYNIPTALGGGTGTAQNSGRFETTAVTYGGYINAMLSYRIQDINGPADIFIGAQYMPMTSAKFNEGGREADLNLKGQVMLTVGLSWPF